MGNNTAKKTRAPAKEVRHEVVKIKEFLAYLTASQHEQLRAQAFKENRSMSAIVRGALDLYLKKHPA